MDKKKLYGAFKIDIPVDFIGKVKMKGTTREIQA